MSPSRPQYPPALPEARKFSGLSPHLFQSLVATIYAYPTRENLTKEGAAAASSLPEGTGPKSFQEALEAGQPGALGHWVGKPGSKISNSAKEVRNRAIAMVTRHEEKIYGGKGVYKQRSLIFDPEGKIYKFPPVLYADASEVPFSGTPVLMALRAVLVGGADRQGSNKALLHWELEHICAPLIAFAASAVVEACFRSHDKSEEGSQKGGEEGSQEGSRGGSQGGSPDEGEGKARYLGFWHWLLSHWEEPGVQREVVGPAQALLEELLGKAKADLPGEGRVGSTTSPATSPATSPPPAGAVARKAARSRPRPTPHRSLHPVGRRHIPFQHSPSVGRKTGVRFKLTPRDQDGFEKYVNMVAQADLLPPPVVQPPPQRRRRQDAPQASAGTAPQEETQIRGPKCAPSNLPQRTRAPLAANKRKRHWVP
ncbi:hypothetical protein K523DRAFT_358475 [Schizophyllum commune Tattone D]|nr:hypothetical protein K523DRAFT_358475 [Schizophyllum commune Tattone D]